MRKRARVASLPRILGRRTCTALALAGGIALTAAAHAGTATVVEYYHPAIRHYFVTAYPDEAAMLDAGNVIKGWVRTGGQFTVYTDPGPDRVPVCRFFGTPGKGPNSHFYTANANECAVVKQNPGWTFEAIAFYIPLPVDNACPPSTYPIWRSFFSDQISDVNHRFTADLTAHTRMPRQKFDPEARGARKIDREYGRLREPALLWTAMIRGLDVTTDGNQPQGAGWQSGQNLFYFPTVFGYYPSDFTLSASSVPAPEFGIFTTAEFLNRANQINDLLYNVDQPWSHGDYGWGPQGFVPNATGTPSPALTAFLPDAGNADALVERINRLFLHGTMTAAMRKTIVTAINKLAPTEALRRVKLALNLTLTSVDYQVQK